MFSYARCCAVALALSTAVRSSADVLNGGFDLGTTSGWISSGPVFVVESEQPRDFLPPPAPDWLPTSGPFFAELWSTDLRGVNSAFLEQTFSANAGDVLYFDCFYDYGDVPPYYDPARITLTPYGQSGADLLTFNTGPSDAVSPAGNVGWLTVATPLDFGGLYTLHLGISDADGSFESILGIDNVHIVPEPGTLLLSGAVMMVLRVGRRAGRSASRDRVRS